MSCAACCAKTPCTGGTQSGKPPCGCVAAAPGAPCAITASVNSGVTPQGQLSVRTVGRYGAVSEGTKGIGIATPKNERYAELLAQNPLNSRDFALGATQDGTVIQPPAPSNFPWLVAGSVLLMVGGLSAMFLATTPQQLGHGAKPTLPAGAKWIKGMPGVYYLNGKYYKTKGQAQSQSTPAAGSPAPTASPGVSYFHATSIKNLDSI